MCKFCTTNCTIYEDRPDSCRAFDCAWLLGAMDEDMRPDKSHIVIEVLPDKSMVMGLVEPGYEDTLNALAPRLSEFAKRGVTIVSSNRQVLLGKGADPDKVHSKLLSCAREMGVI
jgi:hypothetical protein